LPVQTHSFRNTGNPAREYRFSLGTLAECIDGNTTVMIS
jgi:hypothetical protein